MLIWCSKRNVVSMIVSSDSSSEIIIHHREIISETHKVCTHSNVRTVSHVSYHKCRLQSRPPVSSIPVYKICQRLIGNSQPLLFTPTHHRERATMTETNLLRIPTEIRLNIVSTTDNAPRHRQRKPTNPYPFTQTSSLTSSKPTSTPSPTKTSNLSELYPSRASAVPLATKSKTNGLVASNIASKTPVKLFATM